MRTAPKQECDGKNEHHRRENPMIALQENDCLITLGRRVRWQAVQNTQGTGLQPSTWASMAGTVHVISM